jgi:hypothetical protein
MDTIVIESVGEGLDDRFLADEFLEGFRAPLPGEHLVTHEACDKRVVGIMRRL